MGQSAAETVREIQETRARIQNNLSALEERLPERGDLVKRGAAVAVGGTAGGLLLWYAIRRIRPSSDAEPLTNGAAQPVITVVRSGGRMAAWVALASFVLNAIAVAKLRRLSRDTSTEPRLIR
jgi:hypothetical protein